MSFPLNPIATKRTGYFAQAWQGLRSWTGRQVFAAAIGSLIVGLLIGFATVLIPNPVFGRDIPPVWWNYPVWIVTSVLSGMLIATYVKPRAAVTPGPSSDQGTPNPSDTQEDVDRIEAEEKKTSTMGIVGGVLAWFAVGCPVCNKLALLALGYAGAITWFAPLQPLLAFGALLLTGVALVIRLKGQVACPVKPSLVKVAP